MALATRSSAADPRDADLIGLSLAASETEVWYLSFGHRPRDGELAAPEPVPNLPPLDDPMLAPIAALLSDPSVPKAGHNIKHDWQVLRRAGVELAGVEYDAMLASFVLDPGRRSHAIENLSVEHLGRALPPPPDPVARGKAPPSLARRTAPRSCDGCKANRRSSTPSIAP